ncbi:TPA: NEAT domain-containing protein, partial [Bacillus cereus]|nr:NEAT domain-containing protein [Bacillus cereus]
HDVQLVFDQKKLEPIKNEEKQPDEDKKPDAEIIKDGAYSIPFKVLKDKTDEESKMNTYMENPGVLKVENGKKKAIVTLKSSSLIKNFQTEKDG